MSCGQNAEHRKEHLETIKTNQILFHEEIKSKLNSTGRQATIKSRLFRPNLYI